MTAQLVLLPYLVSAAPLLLLLVGLIPSSYANRQPERLARLNGAAAWAAFTLALITARYAVRISARQVVVFHELTHISAISCPRSGRQFRKNRQPR